MKKLQLLTLFAVLVLVAPHARADDPPPPPPTLEDTVDSSAAALVATFGGVFTLGLGVVIAMKAKRYLRRAA